MARIGVQSEELRQQPSRVKTDAAARTDEETDDSLCARAGADYLLARSPMISELR